MAAIKTIKGAKKGQEKARKPSIAKDSASSVSTTKILYGLSEGEVVGLANGAASIRLEGTPLVDENNQPNFEGVTWDFREGTNEQEYIKGFPDVSNETPISAELKSSTPWVRSINDTQLSAIRVRFRWDRLLQTNDENGDVTGYKIEYAIDLKTDGSAYREVLNTKIEDKTSAGYERTHRIDLPRATRGWQIRIRRITPNSTSEYIQDKMYIDAIAEVIDVKLRYPNTALLGLQYNAETFSRIAKLEVDTIGKIIRVPVNYNPVNKTYNGVWNGTFKDAYSNNPAWIYYDLVTQWRYGIGEKLDDSMIDKWSIYRLGQYCDEKVSDGQGGLEPRFECNVYLQSQEDAYMVLSHLGGIFTAMSYWNGEQIVLDADVPQDPVYTFSAANVVEGNFEYTGTRQRDRHTLAKVAWDNPNNSYQTEYEYIRDEEAMAKYGVKPLDLSAFGCTSQAQAQRLGLRALKAEQLETRQVAFSVGLDGFIPQVGNIINISDELFAGRALSGRLSSVSEGQYVVTLDRDIAISSGDTLAINGSNGKTEKRNVKSVSGRKVTLNAPFEFAESESIWALETPSLKLMRFRVMQINQNDDATFNIVALQHDPSKYAGIDNGTDVKDTHNWADGNQALQPTDKIDAPTNVVISPRYRVEQGLSITTLVVQWNQVSNAVGYIVELKKDSEAWRPLPRTNTNYIELDNAYAGTYIARVRAISPFGVESAYAESVPTTIKQKDGVPTAPLSLSVYGTLFGMQLNWQFGTGSADTAFTEIQQATDPSVEASVSQQGIYAYPTDNVTIQGLGAGVYVSYRARLIDKFGNAGEWTNWVEGQSSSDAQAALDLLAGQISKTQLAQDMVTAIDKIDVNELAISAETQARIDEILLANNRIANEARDRAEAVRLLSEGQANIEGNALALVEAINTERQERVDALVDVSDNILLEQQERIEAMRLASLKADELQEFADKLAEDIDTVVVSQATTDAGIAVIKEKQSTFEIENGLQAEKLTYLSSQIDFDYADKTQFANSARSTAWTFAKTIAHADYTNAQMVRGLSADFKDSSAKFTESIELNASAIESLATKTTTLSAETDNNKADILAETTARSTAMEAVSRDMLLLVAKTEDNEAAVTKETEARTSALDAVAEDITTLTAKTGENEAAVKEESRVRTEEDSALSERIVTLTAETGTNKATIQKESEARTTAIESVTKDITTLVSKTENNEAAITRESETRATDFEALSRDIEVVSSKTDGNTASITSLDETLTTKISAQAQTLKFLSSEVSLGYADSNKYADKSRATAWTFAKTLAQADYTNAQMTRGLTADFKDSSARFSENIELLSKQNEAAATKTTNLSAQVMGDYTGGGLGKLNSGLIFEESTARANDVEGLAEQISLLSVGVGEQFDSFDIWHFIKDEDGWTGGTFSGGWVDVKSSASITSPTIDGLDGAMYKHVKLRVKKVGQPTWSGLLTHVGGSKTIKEPNYDEDGVALANWQLDWTGDITSFTLKLASVADAENYYSVDWIAVGRPSPGASNASLLRESKARSEKDLAIVGDLVALNTQVNGDGTSSTTSIVQKLDAVSTLSESSAESLELLEANFETELFDASGIVQTTAKTLSDRLQNQSDRTDLISSDYKPRYADANKNANESRSRQWTYWKTVARENYALSEKTEVISAKVDENDAKYMREITTLATDTKAVTKEVQQISAKTADNLALINSESVTRADQFGSLSTQVTQISAKAQSALDKGLANTGLIQQESTARADQYSSLAQQTQTIQTKAQDADDRSKTNLASVQSHTQSINGLYGQYTLKIDVNDRISGFGLASTNKVSAFNIRADQFYISNPDDPNYKDVGFVYNSGTRADPETGVVMPKGLYLKAAFIKEASVDTLKIKGNAVTVPLAVYTDAVAYVSTGSRDTQVQSIVVPNIDGNKAINISFIHTIEGTEASSATMYVSIHLNGTLLRSAMISRSNNYLGGSFSTGVLLNRSQYGNLTVTARCAGNPNGGTVSGRFISLLITKR